MESKLTQNEIDYIQNLFSEFIKMDGPSRPFPLLAEGIFKIFDLHYDVIEPILDELTNKEYASKNFGAYFPFLVEITSMNDSEIKVLRTKIGNQRYLAKPMILREKKYFICKEFYLDQDDRGANKKSLYKWFCKIFDIEEKTELMKFSKTLILEDDSNSFVSNFTPSLYQADIEKLEIILNGATFTLVNVEKEYIRQLISLYKNNEIDEELKNTVDSIIDRLRKKKAELSNLDL